MNNSGLIDHIYELGYEMFKLVGDKRYSVICFNVKTTKNCIRLNIQIGQVKSFEPILFQKQILEKFLPSWKMVYNFLYKLDPDPLLQDYWFNFILNFEHNDYDDVDFQQGSIYVAYTSFADKSFSEWLSKHKPNE